MKNDDFLRLISVELTWVRGETIGANPTNGTFTKNVGFDGDDQVIRKLKDLLGIVDSFTSENWSSLEGLVSLLPDWFLMACSKPLTNEEMILWLDKWRALAGDAQKMFEDEKGWSALDWLHWLHPKQRGWFVVPFEFRSRRLNQLKLATIEWLIPVGSLVWALHCAGATRITIQDLDKSM